MRTSRRHFLKMNSGLLAFNPIDFLASFMCPLSERFCDHSDGLKNYVLLNLAGAPARWAFDNPLQAKPELKIKSNPMIVTSFKDKPFNSSQDIEFDYISHQVGPFLMPHFWSLPIDRQVSTSGTLDELLENVLIVRGCRMGIDGHMLNAKKLVAPNPVAPSITGLIADKGGGSLPSVGMSGSFFPATATPLGAYRSERGNPLVMINKKSNDYYQEVFENFINEKTNDSKAKNKVLDLLLKKEDFSEFGHNRVKARELISKDLDSLKEQYKGRLSKYEAIILSASKNRNLKGFTDKKIPGIEKRRLKKAGNQDNISFFKLEEYFLMGEDMRDSFEGAQFTGLAQQFALTEFLLINNLTRSITIDLPSIALLNLEKGVNAKYYDEKLKRISHSAPVDKITTFYDRAFGFDMHFAGLIPHHLFTGIYYYVLTNFILELRNALKANGSTFDETLIHLTSEFEREPRPDGLGSDHGYNGQTNTFISGAIDKFKIIGNIYVTNIGKPRATYFDIGTWGEGAPVKSFYGRELVYGNIASSICSLMGVKSPTPKDPAILYYKNGKIKTLFDEVDNLEQV